jgi:hypothetical protein
MGACVNNGQITSRAHRAISYRPWTCRPERSNGRASP